MGKFSKVRSVRIFLADDEWSDVMSRVAQNFIEKNYGETPLVVTVHEHGGWFLSYAMVDGNLEIVSSANGKAIYSDKVQAFRNAIYDSEWEPYTEIRRNHGRIRFSALPVGRKFDYQGVIYKREVDEPKLDPDELVLLVSS